MMKNVNNQDVHQQEIIEKVIDKVPKANYSSNNKCKNTNEQDAFTIKLKWKK